MTKNIKIKLSDDFYKIYSFIHDFGYDSNIEVELVRGILKENSMSYDDEHVKLALEFVRDLALNIHADYQTYLKEYIEWRQSQKLIGGGAPILIILAREIFIGLIILGIQLTVSNKLAKKRESHDDIIIKKLITKLEEDNNEVIIEIKKKYKISKK